MKKEILVVVYCAGEYSDYFESVIGVTDNMEDAISCADKYAEVINSRDDFYLDADNIVVRKYKLNEYRPHPSKGEIIAENIDEPSEKTLYELTLDGNDLYLSKVN